MSTESEYKRNCTELVSRIFSLSLQTPQKIVSKSGSSAEKGWEALL